jgi:hypothetical protein
VEGRAEWFGKIKFILYLEAFQVCPMLDDGVMEQKAIPLLFQQAESSTIPLLLSLKNAATGDYSLR